MPSGEEQPRAYTSRAKIKRKYRRRRSASSKNSESGSESSEMNRDSGYNSQSDRESDTESEADAEDMWIEQKIQEFAKAGVTLSNPCLETEKMMIAESDMWDL